MKIQCTILFALACCGCSHLRPPDDFGWKASEAAIADHTQQLWNRPPWNGADFLNKWGRSLSDPWLDKYDPGPGTSINKSAIDEEIKTHFNQSPPQFR